MYFVAIALVLSVVVPFGAFLLGKRGASSFKTLLGINVFSFFSVLLIASFALFLGASPVLGADEVASAAAGTSAGLAYIAAGLVTGMSTIGAGIAVASSASAALGALSENEAIMGKALIFVALAEGVALYGLLISFIILGKV